MAPQSGAAVVLGPAERSPRIRLHASSLASALPRGAALIATESSTDATIAAGSACVHTIRSFRWLSHSILLAPLRAALLLVDLIISLVTLQRFPEVVIVQCPPSPPALLAVFLAATIRLSAHSTHIICDWHNLGSTILELKATDSRYLLAFLKRLAVNVYSAAELLCAKLLASSHMTVSHALATKLKHLGFPFVSVVRDRAPPELTRRSFDESKELFSRIEPLLQQSGCALIDDFVSRHGISSLLDTDDESNRPAIVVSATSWTPDEEMDILLEALKLYSNRAKSKEMSDACMLPRILCVITGSGPLRSHFEDQFRSSLAQQSTVAVRTAFLDWLDYAKLVGSADVGVSLHVSSSGLDLPMKAVDMLGCGVPVLSVRYSCIGELIRNGDNGLTFGTAAELCDCLHSVLDSSNQNQLGSELRAGAQRDASTRWDDEWSSKALPLILGAAS